jgi:hypothetical protein
VSAAHFGEGDEGGLVGVWRRVKVSLSGAEAAVAKAFFDHLEVRVGQRLVDRVELLRRHDDQRLSRCWGMASAGGE